MEIRWLEAFVAVAEELHFGRAAARLQSGPVAAEPDIRRLERELGVTLFDRSTRSVALTPAGQALLPHARPGVRGAGAGPAGHAGRRTGVFYGTVCDRVLRRAQPLSAAAADPGGAAALPGGHARSWPAG